MNPFVDRMVRAAKLDVKLYEEVEADKGAMGQAVGVCVIGWLIQALLLALFFAIFGAPAPATGPA